MTTCTVRLESYDADRDTYDIVVDVPEASAELELELEFHSGSVKAFQGALGDSDLECQEVLLIAAHAARGIKYQPDRTQFEPFEIDVPLESQMEIDLG